MKAFLARLALCGGVVLAAAGFAQPAQAQVAPGILRDRLNIVAATNAARVALLLTQGFRERYPDAQAPEIQVLSTSRAVELFCAGAGVAMADLLVTTRRLSLSAREFCAANGVEETVELRLGLAAAVLAVRRGDAQSSLTARQVYEALAAEIPNERGFERNRAVVWSQVSAAMPAEQIRFILPVSGSGLREVFEDSILEAGCRPLRQIRMIYEADSRRARCVTLRVDGRVAELAAGEIPARLVASQRGTIAVTSFDEVMRSGGNLVALPIDGVTPTRNSIASGEYEATRIVFLYGKRQHARSRGGVGVVRGIAEYLAEASSEAAIGPTGYLGQAGLVPLPTGERVAQRMAAERMSVVRTR
ncbi:substrate-binding domain-containing protein [Roseomonas sp. CAU 1739]|uniref:PstS family phosphate ABC transporter substrate-binding protein n=1 Tax=Roseomonas sp. CAU 1739 TaxID=3140364 RepID=UPI00325AEBA1